MQKKIIGIVTIVVLGFGGLAAMAWSRTSFDADLPQNPRYEWPVYGSDIFDPDPLLVTELVEVPAQKKIKNPLDEYQMKIVGRLMAGIVKYKKGQWWECGKLMTDDKEIQDRAMFYAYEIVRAADEVSDSDDDDPEFVLNPWGLAGVIRNESQFDRCAFGTHPRKKAYEIGLIKKRKRCISHTEKEVLAAVNSAKMQAYFKKSGFDLGTGQLLSRFYSDPKDFKTMVSVRGSTTEAAWHMRKRGRWYKTIRPWLYWRGYKCQWYDEKITRYARQLGAKPGDV